MDNKIYKIDKVGFRYCPYCYGELVETPTNLWGIHKTLLGKHCYCPWCGEAIR